MKNITALFGFGVAGVVVCLIMTIVTAVQENKQKQLPPDHPIAVPAIGQ
jgi:hypothetical protein